MKKTVDKKVVVIVDASTTNGIASAHALAIKGVNLVLGSPPDRLHFVRSLAHELRWDGCNAIAVECPVGAIPIMEALVRSSIEFYGRLDVVVSNENEGHALRSRHSNHCGSSSPLALQERIYAIVATLLYFPYLQYQQRIHIIIESLQDVSSARAYDPESLRYFRTLSGLVHELKECNIVISTVYVPPPVRLKRCGIARSAFDDPEQIETDIFGKSFARSLCFIVDQPAGFHVSDISLR